MAGKGLHPHPIPNSRLTSAPTVQADPHPKPHAPGLKQYQDCNCVWKQKVGESKLIEYDNLLYYEGGYFKFLFFKEKGCRRRAVRISTSPLHRMSMLGRGFNFQYYCSLG